MKKDDLDISGLMDQSNSVPSGKQPIPPEEEIFKSVYISGKTRTNEKGIIEKAEKLQIRGTNHNNLDQVYGIIMHTKSVLVCNETIAGKDSLKCFSYQSGPQPYKGTSGNTCPKNSKMRQAIPFCKNCKNQLIVSFVLVDENGSPIKDENGELIKIFIRGKGIKYSNISDYLNLLYNEDFSDKILPPGKESQEKAVINNKRVITKIEVGEKPSDYGPKKVFTLSKGKQLSIETTKRIIELSNNLIEEFNKKFDWSSGREEVYVVREEEEQPQPQQMPWDEKSEESREPTDIAGDFNF